MELSSKISNVKKPLEAFTDSRDGSDTAIIVEKVLGDRAELSFDDLCALVNVYFWWNVDITDESSQTLLTPPSYLLYIFRDLSAPQFFSCLEVLHDTFPDSCNFCQGHMGSAASCLEALLEQLSVETDEDAGVLTSVETDADFQYLVGLTMFEDVLQPFGITDDSNEAFLAKLHEYNARKLFDAGADEWEAAYSKKVLETEMERRFIAMQPSFDGSIPLSLPDLEARTGAQCDIVAYFEAIIQECAATDALFYRIMDEFHDVPADAKHWSLDKKIALSRRYFESVLDEFALLEESWRWKHEGVFPSYLYKLAPSISPIT